MDTANLGQMMAFFRNSIVQVHSETDDGYTITTVEKPRTLGVLPDFKIAHRNLQ